MREGLGALLLRKTADSRRNAQKEIENWRRAINTVDQAEQQAECKITLPSELCATILKIADEARVVNHVAAVGLAKLARKQRAEVMAFAECQLREVLRVRKEAEAKAHQDVRQAISERDAQIVTAGLRKGTVESDAIARANQEIGDSPTWGENAPKGCGLGLVIIFLVIWIQSHVPKDGLIYIVVGLVAWPFGIFGWVTLHVILYEFWLVKKGAADRKVNGLKQAAKATFARQQVNAEEQLRQRLPALEQAVTNAEGQCQKAELGLQVLITQGELAAAQENLIQTSQHITRQ